MGHLFAHRTSTIDTENAFKMGPHIQAVEQQGVPVIRLNLGEPDFNIPDFIKDEIKHQLDQNNTHYCDPKGVMPLREAISRHIEKTRRIHVSPEQVVVFPGAKPAIGFSQQVYCDTGDEVIYPSPGYPIFESFIHYLGAKPVPLHLQENNHFTVTASMLSDLISPKTKMIILNFPSNPTGEVATLQQLENIAEVILTKCPPHIRIYSDEIYEKIIFNNQTHHSIASIPGMEKRTIISSGFSKSYAWTGGRVGYAVFPTIEEADIFTNLNINYFSCVPPYNQMAAIVALEHPDSDSTIADMVRIFEERSQWMVAALNTIPGVHCQMPAGTFYVFPNVAKALQELGVLDSYEKLGNAIQTQTSPTTLFQMFALYHHQVAVMDRRSFGKIGSQQEHFLRLSVASHLSSLKEGIQRLKNAFTDVSGFKRFIKAQQHFF